MQVEISHHFSKGNEFGRQESTFLLFFCVCFFFFFFFFKSYDKCGLCLKERICCPTEGANSFL